MKKRRKSRYSQRRERAVANFPKIHQFGPWKFSENQSIWSLLAWHLTW